MPESRIRAVLFIVHLLVNDSLIGMNKKAKGDGNAFHPLTEKA